MMLERLQRAVIQLGLIATITALTACVQHTKIDPHDSRYAPIVYPQATSEAASDGSLYSASGSMLLYDDRKAFRVGDVITVQLNERTVSSKSSNVSIDKESTIEIEEDPAAEAGTILGTKPSFKHLSLLTDLNQSRAFSGAAGADQSNNLQGQITVSVAQVLPNSYLFVRGEKWITLNRGDEFIRIEGIVRPEDIGADNSIQSGQLANARISYSGTGDLANSQDMGWIGRFFNSPYWPF